MHQKTFQSTDMVKRKYEATIDHKEISSSCKQTENLTLQNVL
jgi:hypothetical protein